MLAFVAVESRGGFRRVEVYAESVRRCVSNCDEQ